jgi:hypothetical protein
MRLASLLLIGSGLLGVSVVGCGSGGREPMSEGAKGSGSSGGKGSATGGGSSAGGSGSGGASNGSGGGTGTGGQQIVDVTPGSYALPPPDQCKNQYFVKDCVQGDSTTPCAGECTSANACQNEGKPGAPGFICPRYMLFSDEMQQASTDDATRYSWGATSPFEYAVVGHDTDGDANSVDDPGKSPCCQCYQLVPSLPEDQVLDQKTKQPTIPIPKPLIVQAFNTGATTKTFDIFMGSGGFGAFNACAPGGSAIDYQYTGYPTGQSNGQPSGGGVKAVGDFGNGTACKDQNNLVTAATIGSSACQSLVANACDQIQAATPAVQEETRRSCIDSNKPDSLYHQNWKVYAKRVACPEALTEVTGCKLTENLPPPDPKVTTAAAAAADPSFKTGYSTTTMQDCCKPSCAWQDKVTGTDGGHTASGQYNSFYTCSKDGTPLTEPQ